MSGMETRGRRHYVPDASDFGLVVGLAIVAIIAIALSLAVGLPVAPDAAMFAVP